MFSPDAVDTADMAREMSRRTVPGPLRWSLVACAAFALDACGCGARELPPVPWPPQRDPGAPAVAAPDDVGRTEAPVALVAPAAPAPAPPPEPHASAAVEYELRAPGVRVREGEAHDIAYLEVVLGEVSPDAALPLVVVIHGRGDRPRVPGGPFEALPHPTRIVMPRGPRAVGPGFGWLSVTVAEGRTELLAAELREVSARLARMIATIREERPTRGKAIVAGFSQGGMLTITLAVHHPEVVAVAFPLAGWLPPPLWPEQGPPPDAPPIRAMHALDDERIPFAPARESYEHLRALGWDVELETFEGVGHTMTSEMDGLFHRWLSRAIDALVRSEARLVGAPTPDPDAADDEGDAADLPPDDPPRPARGAARAAPLRETSTTDPERPRPLRSRAPAAPPGLRAAPRPRRR
jgi:phospholipase/carboxylesterase